MVKAENISHERRISALEAAIGSMRDSFVTVIEQQDKQDKKLDEVINKVVAPKTPNYQLWGIVAGMCVPLGITIWTILGLQTENLTLKSENKIMVAMDPVIRSAETSRTDRLELRLAVSDNSEKIHNVENRVSGLEVSTKEKLIENETQHKANAVVANLRQQNIMKWISLMFEKTFGSPLPQDSYYPEFKREH